MDFQGNRKRKKELPVVSIYDLEPHCRSSDRRALTRRSRFYQARIDAARMPVGEKDFRNLPDLYVIHILDYDPFGKDSMVYCFRNCCEEWDGITYDDGLTFLYFNTKGTQGGSKELLDVLHYIQETRPENAVTGDTQKLCRYVEQVRVQPEVRRNYMRVDEILDGVRQDGIEEGIEQGIKMARNSILLELVESNLKKGRTAEQIADLLNLELPEVENMILQCGKV